MAKQADSSVPPRAVREAIKGMSIVEVVKYKIDAWKQSRIYRRRAQKAARTKAANLLGKDPKQSRKANWPRIVKGVVIILILLWLILAAIYLVSKSPQEVPSGASAITLTSTPAIPSAADSASDDDPTALTGEVVHLRVETQQLINADRGTWGPIAEIAVYLSPYNNGDDRPDFDRAGTLRQVTEERRTIWDGVLVAETTFSSSPGPYWVWVDRDSLPEGCEVWLPIFDEDNLTPYKVNPWKVVELNSNDGGNTTVVKFQIVCGLEVEVVSTVVDTPPPGPTPTNSPGPTPTNPPGPTPTPSPTEVICSADCVTPSTPVPTPTEMEATATPSR